MFILLSDELGWALDRPVWEVDPCAQHGIICWERFSSWKPMCWEKIEAVSGMSKCCLLSLQDLIFLATLKFVKNLKIPGQDACRGRNYVKGIKNPDFVTFWIACVWGVGALKTRNKMCRFNSFLLTLVSWCSSLQLNILYKWKVNWTGMSCLMKDKRRCLVQDNL